MIQWKNSDVLCDDRDLVMYEHFIVNSVLYTVSVYHCTKSRDVHTITIDRNIEKLPLKYYVFNTFDEAKIKFHHLCIEYRIQESSGS